MSGRGRVARACLLASPALLALLAFAPALRGGFVHDDVPQIARNPLVQDLRHLPVLWRTSVWAGAGTASSWYRPLMMSSFAVDRALFGPGPLGFHASQLAGHAALVGLFVALVRALGASPAAAAGAGALAAVHPVQAESAAWISARGDVLAVAAGLAALWLHDRALRPGAGRLPALGAGLAFFLALAAKESAVAFAAGFVALDRVRGARLAPAAFVQRSAGWLAAGALYAALRAAALGGVSGGLAEPADTSAWLGFAGQGVRRLLWPAGLTIAPPPPAAGDAALGALACAAAALAIAAAWRRRAPALVPLALGAGALAIAALGAARLGELGDRYLLLPACAAAWLVALAVAALAPAPRRAAAAALAGAVAVFAIASFRHVQVYESDERLWTEAWRRNPAAVRPPLNLAALHLDRGETAEALAWLERAAALAPDDPQIALNRAVAAEQQGDRATARRVLAELVAREPTAWPARLRLAHLELDAGAAAEAAAHYEAIVRAHPLAAEAWAGLGVALSRDGRAREAAAALDRALALDPDVQNAAALRRLRRELAP